MTRFQNDLLSSGVQSLPAHSLITDHNLVDSLNDKVKKLSQFVVFWRTVNHYILLDILRVQCAVDVIGVFVIEISIIDEFKCLSVSDDKMTKSLLKFLSVSTISTHTLVAFFF